MHNDILTIMDSDATMVVIVRPKKRLTQKKHPKLSNKPSLPDKRQMASKL